MSGLHGTNRNRTRLVTRALVEILAVSLLASVDARAQAPDSTTAGEALYSLLNRPGNFLVTDGLFSLIASQTSTFPVSSLASSFTYQFDPVLGLQTRRTSSFGPTFAQRPLTSGRRKLNVGLSFQHTSFDSVDGLPLDDIRTNGIPQPSDRTVLSLEVVTDRVVASATYGVAERVDVGILVPFGRTRVSGSYMCSCPSFGRTISVVEDASSSGIGDVELQTKMQFPSIRVLDVAASVDLRLPTGDQEKLLGTGAAQGRAMFIGAVRHDVVVPHFNVGYTFGGQGFTPATGGGARTLARALEAAQPSPEFDYTVGVDAVVTPYVTLAGDVLGRSLRDSVRIYTMTFPGISEPNEAEAAVSLLLGAVGAKINLGSTWLATFTVLFPLNSNGLKPRVSPVVGFEAAF